MRNTLKWFAIIGFILIIGALPTYLYMNHVFAKEIRDCAMRSAYVSGQVSICGPFIKQLVEKGTVNIMNTGGDDDTN
jgi:hypothetical protein